MSVFQTKIFKKKNPNGLQQYYGYSVVFNESYGLYFASISLNQNKHFFWKLWSFKLSK